MFRYTGRPFDDITGSQNNLNRWYAPSIGRWLSVDPIGFKAGDANLYRYVGNSPPHRADPYGLVEGCMPKIVIEKTHRFDIGKYVKEANGGNSELNEIVDNMLKSYFKVTNWPDKVTPYKDWFFNGLVNRKKWFDNSMNLVGKAGFFTGWDVRAEVDGHGCCDWSKTRVKWQAFYVLVDNVAMNKTYSYTTESGTSITFTQKETPDEHEKWHTDGMGGMNVFGKVAGTPDTLILGSFLGFRGAATVRMPKVYSDLKKWQKSQGCSLNRTEEECRDVLMEVLNKYFLSMVAVLEISEAGHFHDSTGTVWTKPITW